MGIIINLPDNVKQYVSINRNTVSINKQVEAIIVGEPGAGPVTDEPIGPSNETIELVVRGYEVTAHFSIWTDETHYNNRDLEHIAGSLSVSTLVTTLPSNVYEVVYEELKQTLHSYTDDI